MRASIFFATILALAAIAAAMSTSNDSIHQMTISRMRRRRTCNGRCNTGRNNERRATRMCNRAKRPCTVETCTRTRGRGMNRRTLEGHRCVITTSTQTDPTTSPVMSTPTMAPTVSMAPPVVSVGPDVEGPVALPETILFPEAVVVGGTVDVDVTVALDEVSSALQEDIYFLTDATASMDVEITSAQQRFGDLVAARRNASIDVAFGVGFYRDEEDIMNFQNVQPVTKNIDDVISAINSLTAEGASDVPEGNLFALSQVATQDSIGWRDGSRKILVYMGDAPGHEPSCPSGSAPLTRNVVVDQLNAKGIAVVGTNFGPSLEAGLNAGTLSAQGANFGCPVDTETAGGQASRITSGTLGALKLASNPRKLIDVITETIESLDQELDASTMDCAGKVAISFNPALPITVRSGETRRISEHAVIMPAACEFPDGFTCKIDLVLSGVGVRQIIQTTSIEGCVRDDGTGFA